MHDGLLLPISLVIPVRNEAVTLDELFASLQALSPKPSEIVFVDTGSRDSSFDKMKAWVDRQDPAGGIRCELLRLPKALPGAARNFGVRHATHDWIAFIDAGITPHADWLGELWSCTLQSGSDVTYGMCRFTSDHVVGRMICAASSGYGRMQPVLPASLFKKSLFAQHGGFQEALRSGEDLIWMRTLEKADVRISICATAVVEYRHFPEALAPALAKWFVYEQSAVVAKVGKPVRAIFHVGLLASYSLVWFVPELFMPVLLAYFVLRGLVDPLRRGSWAVWWQSWKQFAAMPALVALMDLSSALGRLSAWLGMSVFRRT